MSDKTDPICCGLDMRLTEAGIFECSYREHHPRYVALPLAELLREAVAAGRNGQNFAEFLATRELNTELDEQGYVLRA